MGTRSEGPVMAGTVNPKARKPALTAAPDQTADPTPASTRRVSAWWRAIKSKPASGLYMWPSHSLDMKPR